MFELRIHPDIASTAYSTRNRENLLDVSERGESDDSHRLS